MSDRDAVIPPATQRISRRHLIALSLATLSVASLAACTGDTTPSRAANSQTGGPATEPAANGVFSAVLADYSLTGFDRSSGPKAVAYWTVDRATVLFSDNRDPMPIPISIDPGQQAAARVIAVGPGQLLGATMCKGFCCVSMLIEQDGEKLLQRSVFSATSTNTPYLLFDYNANTPKSGGMLPALPAGELATNDKGQFIYGKDTELAAMNAAGKVDIWTAEGEYSAGIATSTTDVLVLKSLSATGRRNGYSFYSPAKGKRIVKQQVRSYGVDPIGGTAALAFTTTDQVGNDDPTDDGLSPALSVIEIPSGKTVFEFPREDVKQSGFGQIDVIAAFDRQIVISTELGIHLVSSTNGSFDDEMEDEDGSLIIRNAPLLNQPNWALLGEATSDGPDDDTITTLVWSSEPLAWDALGVSLE